jgi:putative spermidine/putrescine transport system permease protein
MKLAADTHATTRVRRRLKFNSGRVLLRAVAGAIFAFLIVPLVVLIPISFSSGTYLTFPPPGFSLKWYARYFGDPGWIDATWLSLEIGAATTVLTLLIGVPLSFGLVRGQFAGRKLLENGMSAPMIVPTIVLSIAIYGLFSRLGLIGEWYGIAIAHSILALPFVVIVLVAALRDFDTNLELAAEGLGASRLTAVRTVTLPMLAPSVYSAAFLAFITSFDELVVAMFLSGANMTLPKKMFDTILAEIEPTVAAVSVMQIILVSMLLVLSAQIRRQASVPIAR